MSMLSWFHPAMLAVEREKTSLAYASKRLCNTYDVSGTTTQSFKIGQSGCTLFSAVTQTLNCTVKYEI